jgi:CII-binding regulator of phage lambda lysogenization HflD
MKLIKFKRLNGKAPISKRFGVEMWEIAFNKKQLHQKLNGDTAEIVMPAKSWFVQLWRKVFPLKFEQCHVEYIYKEKYMKSVEVFEAKLKAHDLKREELQKKYDSYQDQLTKAEDEFNQSLLSNEQTDKQEEELSNKMAQLGKAIDMIKKQLTHFSTESFKRVHSDLPDLFKEDLLKLRAKSKMDCGVIYKELVKQKEAYYETVKEMAEVLKKQNGWANEVTKILIKHFGYTRGDLIDNGFSSFKETEPQTPIRVNYLINPDEVMGIIQSNV